MARTTEGVLAGLLALAALLADAGERHISLNGYDDDAQLLFVNLVAPAAGNPTLYLNAGGMLSELDRFELIGEHSLVIHLPCDDFTGDDTLVYKRGEATLTLGLDGITCSRNQGRLRQPRLVYSHAQCVVDPRGTTLWRVGSLLAEKNGYSVYQNMYAVFLSNRHHFVAEDITRMQDSLLLCPSEELIASIDKRHAVEMFQEAEAFRLASNMQKAAPVGSEEANDPDEGGEQLAQVTASAAAVSTEIAPAEEMTVQEADAGLLAMASAAMDAADNGLPADAYAGADIKAEGDELLAQVTSPADAVVEMAADSEHLAMASTAMDVADNGQPADAYAGADIKAEGDEQLAQVIAPAEAASAELASVKEVAERAADAGLLAMAAAVMDASDDGAAADVSAVVDEKSEGGEQLAQVTSPADAVVEMAADSEHLAMASAAMDVADNGQPADAYAGADVKSEDGELLAQVTSPADAVSADAVVDMAADSEHLVMASAAMGAADKDLAASAEVDVKSEDGELLAQATSPADAVFADAVVEMAADSEHLAMASAAMDVADNGQPADAYAEADVKSEDGELLAQVTAPSEGVAEQEVDAELLAMSENEDDGEQPLGQFTAPAEVAKQEHPIVDTTLAVISGGDKDVVPKLVIAIDGGKQAGHLNVVPGCYIEPNNKTLWRVGLALNKLNGHTVYQNMYAVFAVNPKAFPSGNVNHMLNQKLRCPSAREVTKHTTKESKALMELDLPG